jgi:O-antigen/teichoic acid export membrane protein
MIARLKSLKNHQGFMKYFKNSSWVFAEKIVRMITGLFVGIWVARYLGPEQFGLFSYAQSFVGLFTAIATLGLDGVVVRELVKDEGRKYELLGTAFWLKVLGAFSVLLIVSVAVTFTSNDTDTNMLVAIITSATIFQSFNIIDFYFQSKVMSKFVVYANFISLFVSSIIKVILILNEAPLVAFAWVIFFDGLILACGLIYFYSKKNQEVNITKFKFRINVAFLLLKDSWPLILSAIVVSIYMRIDQVMIKEMIDTESVGQYAAAVRISEIWYFLPMAISTSLLPALINAKKRSEKLYYARLQKLFDLMVWMAIAIAVPMAFLSDRVAILLYGEQYNQTGGVLMIHIWAGVFVFLGVASGKWILVENLPLLSFWRTFYGMIINIILNSILIPAYGIQGSAIATLISYFVAGFMIDLLNKKTRHLFYMKLNTINLRRLLS